APPLADRFIVGVAPIDYGPVLLLKPFGFHLAVDTLPSGVQCAVASGPPWLYPAFAFVPVWAVPYLPLSPASEALPPLLDMALLIRAPEGLQPSRTTHCSAHTISQSDCRQVIGSSLRCRLVGPYKRGLNLSALPCSRELLWLHASGTNPGSISGHSPCRVLRFRLPRRGIGSATSITFDFRAIFPFTVVPACTLPVYASQCPHGHHARLGTRLPATRCRGRHCRRLDSRSFQGATPT